MYRKGMGVLPNPAIAFHHFRTSSILGNDADAHFQVGVMLEVGEGTEKQVTEASDLFKLAAVRGHPYAWIKFHAHKKSYEKMLAVGSNVRLFVLHRMFELIGDSGGHMEKLIAVPGVKEIIEGYELEEPRGEGGKADASDVRKEEKSSRSSGASIGAKGEPHGEEKELSGVVSVFVK
jgi:hypothetical protein